MLQFRSGNQMREGWQPVVGRMGYYVISDHGNIRNCKTGKLLKGWINKRGYREVKLHLGGAPSNRHVHLLVLMAFKGMSPGKVHGRHVNGDLTDNRLENLEWMARH